MLRAAESGNEDTYRLSLESIYEQIVRYQAQFYDRTENKNKPIDYPNDYYGIFSRNSQSYHPKKSVMAFWRMITNWRLSYTTIPCRLLFQEKH